MRKSINMSGAIGRVTVERPIPVGPKGCGLVQVKAGPVAWYPGESEADAREFAAAIAASYAAHKQREAARPAPSVSDLKPCPKGSRHFARKVHHGCDAVGSRMRWPDHQPILDLAARFNEKRGRVVEPVKVAAPKAAPKPRKIEKSRKARTAQPPAMQPAYVATDSKPAPCPRCGRADWRSEKGRAWHVENNPDCVKYRRPDRHEYASA